MQRDSSEAARHALDHFWIENNVSFLNRYWQSASEALQRIATDPKGFTEFQSSTHPAQYVEAIIASHQEHHTYTGVLLTYAVFDECMVTLASKLGLSKGAPLFPGDLRDRGVSRYRKYVHDVCKIEPSDVAIDWSFLEDFAMVRNAIIHANGNKGLLSAPEKFEQVVARHSGMLAFKHEVKLRISAEFVTIGMAKSRDAALALNDIAHPDIPT